MGRRQQDIVVGVRWAIKICDPAGFSIGEKVGPSSYHIGDSAGAQNPVPLGTSTLGDTESKECSLFIKI